MKSANSTRDPRFATPARVAAAAAAAAALTASLALVGHVGGASLASAQVSGGITLVASGSAQPDSPMPCLGPEYCNVG